MTIASVVLVPPILAFSLIFFRRVKIVFKAADEAEGRLTATIQENLSGIRVVRAFARQAFERDKLAVRNAEHRAADYRLYRVLALFWSASDLLCFAQKALVLGLGLWLLMRGELTIGAFFFFLTAVAMFIWPVRMSGRILADLGKALVALGRIDEILNAEREEDPATPQLPAGGYRGAITFENVSFAYGEVGALHDVSLDVPAGGTIALLGPSGSGKSTIVRLLLRLIDPDAGRIIVDGVDLADIPRKDARRAMAVVMQEPFLYSKSLRDNVTLAVPDVNEDAMVEATSEACVHDAIERFEHGYDTLVGERGVTLSGGQRQRVALARALLPSTAVLVLDDALSAVDTETESMILDALRRRRGKQTTILIAHRLSTLQHAEQIVVLEHGRVVQSGTHDELIADEGLYRRLWQIQQPADDALALPETKGAAR
jgi:ATP-binding cassette subfamily B protein